MLWTYGVNVPIKYSLVDDFHCLWPIVFSLLPKSGL